MPPGTRLGEFEITGVVGEGGFGIVYSARDSSLDRIVAIKEYLPSAFAARTAAGTVQVRSEEHSKTFDAGLSSFINEARMLAKFSHPGLVEVFRFWEANGTAYMAMRYYRGVTLREMLRTNPQIATEQWLCETLDPILLALQELHNEKCYHRDIAPDNILVLPNGRSVLMDFGAARRIIGGMTRALTTVLKPGYAPIEQYSDDGSMQQGAWTDIYAVGGVLYHAMTGKVPVQAISRMMNDPLKPVATAARGEYSANLCAVVMKCLAVMPENRYQTIDELREALGWVTTPVSSTVVYTRTVHAAPALAAATPAAAAPPPQSMPPAPVSRTAAASPDPLQGVLGSSTADPLADLLATASPPPPARPAATIAGDPAATLRRPPDLPSASSPQKRNILPLVVVGVAALAVLGSAVYLLVGGSSPDASPPKVVLVPPPPAAQPDPAPPVQATAVPAEKPDAAKPETPPVAPTPDLGQSGEKGIDTSPSGAPGRPGVGPVSSDGSKQDPGAAIKGTVTLDIKPWGNVSVNGAVVGPSPPLKRLPLAPGTYTIEVQNPAGPTLSRSVEVVSGKSISIRHSF
jgi:non-specific serine/threonine protein kinase